MNDVLKAYDANFAAGKTDFVVKFRSKKDNDASLAILSKHWGHKTGAYAKVLLFKVSEPIPSKVGHDMRLLRTRLNCYHLCIPVALDIRGENQAPPATDDATIALDPGVRTFLTGYDSSGQVVEWGIKDISRITRLCVAVDKLQSRWAQKDICHRKRYRLQRAARHIRLKIRNLVDDLHRRCASWLCKNYRAIVLPKFETSKMILRGKRRIKSKTARAMLTWSHYRFRMHLLHKQREYPWCTVYLCTEEYTSKTCTGCGHLHHTLGGNKVFKCPACKIHIDRDVNGARNILLKFLTELFERAALRGVH